MNTEHPSTPPSRSLASSESTLGPNDKTDMDASSMDKHVTLDTTVIPDETTRRDAPSETDDAGHDHDEPNDSNVHSEAEDNDGISHIRIALTK